MPLKVLMLAPEFYPNLGGTEIQALNLSKGLQERGARVAVLTRMREKSWLPRELVQEVAVRRVDYPRVKWLGGGLLNLRLGWEILRHYRDCDVFHFHIGESYMVLPLLVTKALGKPSLLKISGWWEMERGFLRASGLSNRLMRKVLFRVGTIVAVSEEIRERVTSMGYPSQRVLCLPNGVDTRRFAPASPSERPPRIIFVGRLVPVKGLPVLLGAVRRLKEHFPELALDLVGAGFSEEELKQLVGELGLEAQVRFLGRIDDTEAALAAADIFVQPSLSEGLPNSLLEAMACGLPCVVTNVGGMPQVVQDGVHGFVVEANRVEELALALERLLSDRALRLRMGQQGRAKMLREFSLDAVAENYLAYYRKVARN